MRIGAGDPGPDVDRTLAAGDLVPLPDEELGEQVAFGAKDRAFNFQVLRAVFSPDDNRAGEIADAFAFGLDDLDAALFGDHGRIDVVDGGLHDRR